MLMPTHLKLNAVLSTLDAPEAIGRAPLGAPGARMVSSPIYIRRWPEVQNLLKGMDQCVKWVWAMVRRMFERIAKLFGLRVSVPEQAPGANEPAAQFQAPATDADREQVAQNVADASAQAAREVDEFLRQLLDSPPDRERLKDDGAAAFAAHALQVLGSQLQPLKEKEQRLSAAFTAEVDRLASEMGGVAPQQVLIQAMKNHSSGLYAQLAPLWGQLQEHRQHMQLVRSRFCEVCILAVRKPDGIVQPEVDEVVQSAIVAYADLEMQKRIAEGVKAPSLQTAMDAADAEPQASQDPVHQAAKEAFGGATAAARAASDESAQDEPSAARPAAPRPASVDSLMARFRSAGVAQDDAPSAASNDENDGDARQRPAA